MTKVKQQYFHPPNRLPKNHYADRGLPATRDHSSTDPAIVSESPDESTSCTECGCGCPGARPLERPLAAAPSGADAPRAVLPRGVGEPGARLAGRARQAAAAIAVERQRRPLRWRLQRL